MSVDSQLAATFTSRDCYFGLTCPPAIFCGLASLESSAGIPTRQPIWSIKAKGSTAASSTFYVDICVDIEGVPRRRLPLRG